MTFLDDLKEKRTTYAEMIDFCCDNCILNNDIIDKLSQNGYYFNVFCGDYYTEREVYQYYLINYNDARRLSNYTNELVIYNEELELYILCVCHWGTSWDYVSSNWKDKEDENED